MCAKEFQLTLSAAFPSQSGPQRSLLSWPASFSVSVSVLLFAQNGDPARCSVLFGAFVCFVGGDLMIFRLFFPLRFSTFGGRLSPCSQISGPSAWERSGVT